MAMAVRRRYARELGGVKRRVEEETCIRNGKNGLGEVGTWTPHENINGSSTNVQYVET